MPRKTGRDAGNGQFIPLAQAAAMGERATIESTFSGRRTKAMDEAGVEAVRKWAARAKPEPGDRSEYELAALVWDAMWDARPT